MSDFLASFLVLTSLIFGSNSDLEQIKIPLNASLSGFKLVENIEYEQSVLPTPIVAIKSSKIDQETVNNIIAPELNNESIRAEAIINEEPKTSQPTGINESTSNSTEGNMNKGVIIDTSNQVVDEVPQDLDLGEFDTPGYVESGKPDNFVEDPGPAAPNPDTENYIPLEINGPNGIVTVSY